MGPPLKTPHNVNFSLLKPLKCSSVVLIAWVFSLFFLKDELNGEAIEITAGYPVALYNETLKNLEAAAAGEHEEWSTDYPEFARIAREEGFNDIAVLSIKSRQLPEFC